MKRSSNLQTYLVRLQRYWLMKDIVTLRKMFYRYMEKENQINKKIFTEK